MTATPSSAKQGFRLNRDELLHIADRNRDTYASAPPFPHVVMDDFLPSNVLDGILQEFPDPREGKWFAFDSALERKLASEDESAMGPATRHLLADLNAAPFIDFLERLTGIEGLVPDPHLLGGGLHQIQPGGHLKVHADFNQHPRTSLERRLNVLLYLNRDWKDEYGGALELWSRDMTRCEARILPHFNRCVVFSTTSTSYHGHPEPLSCPEDRTRKSLALYYYSRDRPDHERAAGHSTLFQARPGEHLPVPPEKERPRLGERALAIGRRLAPPIAVDAVRRLRSRHGPSS